MVFLIAFLAVMQLAVADQVPLESPAATRDQPPSLPKCRTVLSDWSKHHRYLLHELSRRAICLDSILEL